MRSKRQTCLARNRHGGTPCNNYRTEGYLTCHVPQHRACEDELKGRRAAQMICPRCGAAWTLRPGRRPVRACECAGHREDWVQ